MGEKAELTGFYGYSMIYRATTYSISMSYKQGRPISNNSESQSIYLLLILLCFIAEL